MSGRVIMASKKLKLGDIVFCERRSGLLGRNLYQHYGVYAGYHKIIHYVKGNSPLDGRIAETSIEEFCDGDTLYIAEDDTLLSIFQDADVTSTFYGPRKTVQRARSMIGKGDYNLFNHNCEHFAIWCKTGHLKSTQTGLEGMAARFLRPKLGPFKWFVDDIWRVEAEY